MNILKNMEAIFLAAAFLSCVAGVASAASENAHERYQAQAQAQASVQGKQMAVVRVTAKRLTAAEKAAL